MNTQTYRDDILACLYTPRTSEYFNRSFRVNETFTKAFDQLIEEKKIIKDTVNGRLVWILNL